MLIMIAILILLRKKPERRGLGIIVSVVISMTAYMLIYFCPTENFFVDFDTLLRVQLLSLRAKF